MTVPQLLYESVRVLRVRCFLYTSYLMKSFIIRGNNEYGADEKMIRTFELTHYNDRPSLTRSWKNGSACILRQVVFLFSWTGIILKATYNVRERKYATPVIVSSQIGFLPPTTMWAEESLKPSVQNDWKRFFVRKSRQKNGPANVGPLHMSSIIIRYS